MHPWSKDRGCPFARVGPTSIRSPRGSPGVGGAASADLGYGAPPSSRVRGEWPAPGSLSPRGVGPQGSDETWPQSRVPRGGPEPSRAQLLQGRAASDKNPNGQSPGLPLANPETANPRVQAWSSGAQAGRILCGNQPRPLARRTRSFRPVTRPLREGVAAVGKVQSVPGPRPSGQVPSRGTQRRPTRSAAGRRTSRLTARASDTKQPEEWPKPVGERGDSATRWRRRPPRYRGGQGPPDTTSREGRLPAKFKHIIKRRKRNQQGFP